MGHGRHEARPGMVRGMAWCPAWHEAQPDMGRSMAWGTAWHRTGHIEGQGIIGHGGNRLATVRGEGLARPVACPPTALRPALGPLPDNPLEDTPSSRCTLSLSGLP